MSKVEHIAVIDFFSGCGGTSSGFKAAGLNILAGLDIDEDAAKTFQLNFPESKFILEDIRELNVNALAPIIGARNTPLLFAGCAPCQPFSQQNKTACNLDPRRELLKEFARFVEFWLPEYVFIENVPGLQRPEKKDGPLESFQQSLTALGYFFETKVVSALSFGVPQNRDRLTMVASRLATIGTPQATYGASPDLSPLSTVRDWIFDLPEIKAGEKHKDDCEHVAPRLSELNLRRIKATPEGGDRRSWPKELWLDCHKSYKGHTDVYGRLAWDRPASCLTTKCISYSNGRFGHPVQNRALSIREAACLQTFPREYKFFGSMASRARQIGNAVPPLMAQSFGDHFKNHYKKYQQ